MNHTTLPARQTLPRRSTGKASRRKKTFWLLTMVMPGTIWLLLLRYLPMYGILIAFKNYRAYKPNTFWNNIIQSEWVGLKNFAFLKSPDTAVMIRNALGDNGPQLLDQLVHREAILPRHRRNGLAASLSRHHEHRPDELLGTRFRHREHVADRRCAAKTAEPDLWIAVHGNYRLPLLPLGAVFGCSSAGMSSFCPTRSLFGFRPGFMATIFGTVVSKPLAISCSVWPFSTTYS